MAGIFGLKYFNDEVFGKYVDTVPRVKQNAFLKAGVLNTRNELKTLLRDQTGGNFISVPMSGRISGDPVNYDGNTDITEGTISTYLQSMIVVGRAKGWKEQDFNYDLTGEDFMEKIAQQVGDYWDDVDQTTILATLAGIFGVTEGNFSSSHTYDISSAASAADAVVNGASLNNAIQKAAGANKNIFTLVIMHSQVATNLENLELLTYRTQTDANGIQRRINLADWNGRTVLVDDDVPVTNQETTAGVYGAQITTAASAGDKIKINGVEFTWIANGETPADGEIALPSTNNATNEASALVTALNASTDERLSHYTWSNSTSTLKATEDSGHYGEGAFTVKVTQGESGTMVVGDVSTITAPVFTPVYTTYILGQGAIDFCDVGAKVPYETDRDRKTKGGIDLLYTRQRKIFAPYGFTFKQPGTAIISPTDTQLATAARWGLVQDTDGNTINTKAIPIARIISKG